MRRYDLTDEQFARLDLVLPQNDGKVGHPWRPHRPIINGIFWRLRTSAPWQDIPERYGKWKTIYDRYVWWRRNGTWSGIITALQMPLHANGEIDWSQWSPARSGEPGDQTTTSRKRKSSIQSQNYVEKSDNPATDACTDSFETTIVMPQAHQPIVRRRARQ